MACSNCSNSLCLTGRSAGRVWRSRRRGRTTGDNAVRAQRPNAAARRRSPHGTRDPPGQSGSAVAERARGGGLQNGRARLRPSRGPCAARREPRPPGARPWVSLTARGSRGDAGVLMAVTPRPAAGAAPWRSSGTTPAPRVAPAAASFWNPVRRRWSRARPPVAPGPESTTTSGTRPRRA